MNHIKHFVLLLVLSASCTLYLSSCESSEPKAPDDFEAYKQEKISSADSDSIKNDAENMEQKAKAVASTEPIDEWTALSNLVKRKIASNTSKIKSIRAKSGASSKMLSKANRLEQDNADLNTRLQEYKTEADERLRAFSDKINSDADAISTELTELTSSPKQ